LKTIINIIFGKIQATKAEFHRIELKTLIVISNVNLEFKMHEKKLEDTNKLYMIHRKQKEAMHNKFIIKQSII